MVLVCGSLTAPRVLLAQLPPDIQADLLMVEAEREIEAGNHSAGVAKFDELIELREQHDLEMPPEFWFKRAEALREAGYFGKAAESAERYALEAGREGEHYRAALEFLASMPSDGDVFRDCVNCPEMVLIPSGSFRMGCLSSDDDCYEDELPVHEVSIQSFALSKHEVTFEEWNDCARYGGCNGESRDVWRGAGHPLGYVSWEEAQSFVAWLSEVTGHAYRLPTESEWEYAARAGAETKYSWGNGVGNNRASCGGCGSQWDDDMTAPVGSFGANAFGLHDMHGNVYEWVEDCSNDSYEGAPSDGRAWLSGNCDARIFRGGCFDHGPRDLRSARRKDFPSTSRSSLIGFRVARTLAQ